MKKAQGMSLNVIIIAAIALIVMVVLIAIFTGRMGSFNEGLTKIETKYCDGNNIPAGKTASGIGGSVKQLSVGCDDLETKIYGAFEDVNPNQVCCLPK